MVTSSKPPFTNLPWVMLSKSRVIVTACEESAIDKDSTQINIATACAAARPVCSITMTHLVVVPEGAVRAPGSQGIVV